MVFCKPLLAIAWTLPLVNGCQLWVGEYEADGKDPIDTSALCKLEHRLFDVDLDLGSDDQRASLQEYYAAANPDLVEQFNAIVKAAAAPAPTRTATYLTGEAGAGKSFMMRSLVNAFPSEDICDLSLPEVLAADSDTLATEKRPDLATVDGSVTLNSLPGLRDPDSFFPARFPARSGLRGRRSHDAARRIGRPRRDSSSERTRAAARSGRLLLSDDQAFVHVVVLGRPEGYAPWFASPSRGEDTGRVVKLMSLKTPLYVTRGDIAFRLREYLDFTMQLGELEANGELDGYVDGLASALDDYSILAVFAQQLGRGQRSDATHRTGFE